MKQRVAIGITGFFICTAAWLSADPIPVNPSGVILSPQISSFSLSELDGANGFRLDGIDSDDHSGTSARGVGDVNGDGLDDLIIGACLADPNGITYAGSSYVVFGTASGVDASMELASLNGTNGFCLNGGVPSGKIGYVVSGAGDVNGDGLNDLIIGAASPNSSAGESYVVFGAASGFDAAINLDTLNGTNGFRLEGINLSDYCGRSVSGAGDINGDGFDDLVLGVLNADYNGNTNAGESYVVFGAATGFDALMNLDSLNGTNGFCLGGIDPNDGSGCSVSGAGDVNGDGIDDLIIGATGADSYGNSSAGESYVVLGTATGFASNMPLSSLNGTNGFCLGGIDSSDCSGTSVSGAGDVNGDGIDDLIIGALYADFNGNSDAGESYVVFGTATGFASNMPLSSLNGTNGFCLGGVDSSDRSGTSVSGAGDVNGDGFDDLVVGARYADPNGNSDAGESYVVFGAAGGFASTVPLSSLNGTNGFRLDGINSRDYSGASVSDAGDVNGDGFDDLIVGAWNADPNGISGAGESYVVFGGSSGQRFSIEERSLVGGEEWVISGLNLGDGTDITHVTLCGVEATILSQTSNSVTVITGQGLIGGVGDIFVISDSLGSTSLVNGFNYIKVDQTIDFLSIDDQLVTNTVVLSATVSAGLPVTFSVLSGSAALSDGTHLSFSGSGTITVVAHQLGNDYYHAAAITNKFTVSPVPGLMTYADVSSSDDSGDGLSWATAKQSIQSAIDLVGEGGTVWVTNGTYTLSSQLEISENITVQSVHGAEVTILDGGGSVRCAMLSDGVLAGFSLTNGYFEGQGGGAYLKFRGSLNNCTLSGNSADSGGGVYLNFGGTLNNCTLSGNSAHFGGGVYIYYGGRLNNCLLSGNSAGYRGGGAYFYGGGVLNNCTLSGNTAVNFAGGAYLRHTGMLNNCIVWGNTGLSYNDIYKESGAIRHTCASDGVTHGVDGCITNNPLLVSTNNYHLTTHSPCINTGNDTYLSVDTDLDGNLRVYGSAVDMGAYESQDVFGAYHVPSSGDVSFVFGFDNAGTNTATVTIGGLPATIDEQTPTSLTGRGPVGLLPGTYDMLIDGTFFAGAYVVNPPGLITEIAPEFVTWNRTDTVTIIGSNLSNGMCNDVTGVSLCGIDVYSIRSISPTQIVVTAAIGTADGLGDVIVESSTYGTTVASNAFSYAKTDQIIDFPAIEDQISSGSVQLDAVASSKLPVCYTFSGPGSSADGTNLTFTGSGWVSVIASQPGGTNWNAAVSVTNQFVVVDLDSRSGPVEGGNSLTINLGLGSITNVLVGGVPAPIYSGLGTSIVTVHIPVCVVFGSRDIVISTSDLGDVLLTDAYSYTNLDGEIFGEQTIYLMNDFESAWSVSNAPTGGMPGDDWRVAYVTNSNDWRQTTSSLYSRPASARTGAWNDGTHFARLLDSSTDEDITCLLTPPMDLSGIGSAALSFWHVQDARYDNQDTLRVWVHTNFTWAAATHEDWAAAGWQELAFYSDESTDWTQRELELTNLGSNTVIAFEGTSRYGYGVCLDDVKLFDPASGSLESGSCAGGYSVVISGTNLCNGIYDDVTNVTLAGVPVTSVDSVSLTQIVVTAATGPAGLGEISVESMTHGTITKLDGFRYIKADQSIDFQPIENQRISESIDLTATSTSGLAVHFGVVSGLASIRGTTLTLNGAGPVQIVAYHDGDESWNAAAPVTNSFIGVISDQMTGSVNGGNLITLDLGFGSITNVTLGGISAVLITGEGTSLVTALVPACVEMGARDVVFQTSEDGEIRLPAAYIYTNLDGQIFGRPNEICLKNDFESAWSGSHAPTGGLPDDDWRVAYVINSNEWQQATVGHNSHPAGVREGAWNDGTQFAYLYDENYDEDVTRLLSPPLDFSEMDSVALSFWHIQQNWGDQDTLRVLVHTNFTWTAATNADWVAAGWQELAFFSEGVSDWTLRELELTELGSNTVIAFEGTSDYGYGVGLDDVQLMDTTPGSVGSGSCTGGYSVVISGTNLCNGILSDVTSVTLAGVPVASIDSVSSTQIVVTAAASGIAGPGDVVIESTSHGTLTKNDGFIYMPPPDAPVALSAINITDSQFVARWVNTDETTTHYFVDVSETTNFTVMTGAYNNWNVGPSTACLVTNLTRGETYYYRVRAGNQFGSSLDSNIIEVPVSTNTPYCDYELNSVASSGSGDVVDLTEFFHGSELRYNMTSNSNPNLVTVTVDNVSGSLTLDYANGVTGTAAIIIRATDISSGFWVENTIHVEIVPPPTLTRIPNGIAFNPQTGLFEEVVTVENNSVTRAAQAVTLTVSNLTAGATLYNATGTDSAGNQEIHWVGTLAANDSMDFTLQYYTAQAGVPTADVSASLSMEEPAQSVSGNSFNLCGKYQNINNSSSFLIEFSATPGSTYYIQYRKNLSDPWKTVQPGIVAPANYIQWIDSGPPGTECAPGDAVSRFYRIIESD